MRGVGSTFNLGASEANVFIGADQSSYFIGGGKYSIKPVDGFNIAASGLYVARDKQYSGFGTELGVECKQTFEHFLRNLRKSRQQSDSKQFL